MAGNYYLANGENGNATTLVLDTLGTPKREFNDISSLDLATLELPFDQAKDILQLQNTGAVITDEFFSVQYPYKKKEIKTFVTAFDYSTDANKDYLEMFKYFAKQRQDKILSGQKVLLDENSKYNEAKYRIFKHMLNGSITEYIDHESLIPYKLKQLLMEYRKDYGYMSVDNFLKKRYYVTNNFMRNYTTMRKMILEIMFHDLGYEGIKRTDTENYRKWDVSRLDSQVDVTYEQLDCFDLLEQPYVRKK